MLSLHDFSHNSSMNISRVMEQYASGIFEFDTIKLSLNWFIVQYNQNIFSMENKILSEDLGGIVVAN